MEILDLGAGTGRVGEALAEKGFKIIDALGKKNRLILKLLDGSETERRSKLQAP